MIATVRHRLVRMAHGDGLLLHLVRELKGSLGSQVSQCRLQWVKCARAKLLGRGNHPHVDILLMGSLELLLLLLEELDLLLDGKLVHCKRKKDTLLVKEYTS